MLRKLLARSLERLYAYDTVRALKDRVRPVKHWIFGKSDIYYVVDAIARARGASRAVTTVLDVGAAVGDKTLTFLRAFPQATVHCFEPQTTSRERLLRRTARYANRVHVHAYGLFNQSRVDCLRLYSYADASSLLPIPAYMRRDGKDEVGTEPIHLRRLDECLPELGCTHIDLLKIDVEGVEREVLEGASRALDDADNVFVEITGHLRKGPHATDFVEVFQLLRGHGFAFLGQYGDFWFSKDQSVLTSLFGDDYTDAALP